MNKYIKTLLVMAGGVLVACTNDDGNTNDGKTPLTLTAAGITAPTVTRATVDGTWEEDDYLAVKIGDGAMAAYTVTDLSDDNKKAKLTPEGDVAYYEDEKGKTITAWNLYSQGQTEPPAVDPSVKQNIIGFYNLCDYLVATATIDAPTVALEFKHQTAKIHITLKDAVGDNGYILDATAKKGLTITAGKTFQPYRPDNNGCDYYVLVAPGDVAFKVQFEDRYGTKYVFDGGTRTFEAGKQYDFELRVGKEGLILSGCTIKGWDEKTGGELNRIDYEVIDGVYHVYTEAGLKAWAEAVKENISTPCLLEADITMTKPAAGENSNWTAIGDANNSYTGTFDGNGHTISNLIVSGDGHQGFIGKLYGGTVKNLTLKDVSVTATLYHAGAVAGYSGGKGSIYGCQVIGGSVTSPTNVGGIVGDDHNSSIYACSAKCDVTGSKCVGGIAGSAEGTTITACWTNSTIDCSDSSKGAIAGSYASSATATDCYYIKNNGVTDTKGTEKTDDQWNDPIDAMNAAIKDMEHDYVWDWNNDGATNNKVPLVLVKKKSTN